MLFLIMIQCLALQLFLLKIGHNVWPAKTAFEFQGTEKIASSFVDKLRL